MLDNLVFVCVVFFAVRVLCQKTPLSKAFSAKFLIKQVLSYAIAGVMLSHILSRILR